MDYFGFGIDETHGMRIDRSTFVAIAKATSRGMSWGTGKRYFISRSRDAKSQTPTLKVSGRGTLQFTLSTIVQLHPGTRYDAMDCKWEQGNFR